jgi:hypothetical protein
MEFSLVSYLAILSAAEVNRPDALRRYSGIYPDLTARRYLTPVSEYPRLKERT